MAGIVLRKVFHPVRLQPRRYRPHRTRAVATVFSRHADIPAAAHDFERTVPRGSLRRFARDGLRRIAAGTPQGGVHGRGSGKPRFPDRGMIPPRVFQDEHA